MNKYLLPILSLFSTIAINSSEYLQINEPISDDILEQDSFTLLNKNNNNYPNYKKPYEPQKVDIKSESIDAVGKLSVFKVTFYEKGGSHVASTLLFPSMYISLCQQTKLFRFYIEFTNSQEILEHSQIKKLLNSKRIDDTPFLNLIKSDTKLILSVKFNEMKKLHSYHRSCVIGDSYYIDVNQTDKNDGNYNFTIKFNILPFEKDKDRIRDIFSAIFPIKLI